MDVLEMSVAPDAVPSVEGVPTERLEAEICTVAGRLAAMECRWLLLVGEFDRRQAFDAWECRSTAHWLTWKCAMGSRTAHEKVRVARDLEGLPLVTAAFAAGELSYSKVRAISRIATPATEEDLVTIARHATGAQIECLAAGRRRADRLDAESSDTGTGDPGYSVRWHHDESGAVVIHARLAPESGAVVINALDEAIRQERATPRCHSGGNVSQKCSAEHSHPDPGYAENTGRSRSAETSTVDGTGSRKCSAEHSPNPHRCGAGADCPNRDRAAVAADALTAIADSHLARPDRLRSGNDRYTTLVIVDEDTLTGADPDGSCVLDDGTHIDTPTARRWPATAPANP